MRDSTIIYRSFYEAIKDLSVEVQGEVWLAVFEYSLNFKTTELNGIAKTVFTLIKPQLDANIKRYKNGSKPKQKQEISKTEARDKQVKSKKQANENVNENVNLNANKNNNTISHEQVVEQTLDNEIFCEQSAMALKCDYNIFVSFISDRLAEMKITGHSTKYPLGTIKNILIQDFKLESEKEKRYGKNKNGKAGIEDMLLLNQMAKDGISDTE
jgi:hypothetical protein